MGSLTTILGNTLQLLLGPMVFGDGSLDLVTGSLRGVIEDIGGDPTP